MAVTRWSDNGSICLDRFGSIVLPLPGIKQIMAFTATQKIHLFQVKADSEFEARAKIKLPNQRGEALAEVAMTLSPGEQVNNLKRYYRPRLHQCSAPWSFMV